MTPHSMPTLPAIRRRERTPDGQTVDQDHLRACADYGQRPDGYRLYQDMYDGEHRTRLTDRQRAYLVEATGVNWSENFIETIINVTKERMNLVGFQAADNEDVSDWLTKRAWQGNRADQLQGTVHINTMVKGDGFVLVTPGPDGLPRYQYNRPELHKPVYDDDGQMLFDVKRWATSKITRQNPKGALVWRVNLFYPDRVEKYFSLDREGKNWAVWQDDDDPGWPVWWTDNQQPDGEPLGILAVHFRNQAFGRDWGRSDVRGLIPFQQELHKQLLDLFDVMDAQGWQQRWATGVENAGGLRTNPGEVWTGPDGAIFGQFDAADPTRALAAVSATLHRMAAKARVPIHVLLMEGVIPSGESLKTANSPLVKKADDRKVDAGNGWEDVSRLGWRVADAFGAPDVPEFDPAVQITALWDSSEDRNETSEITNAGLKQDLGVSRASTLRELGYDPDEEARRRREETAAEGPPPPAGTGAE